jgi:trimethylamine--corrinoid protein Co-methyltransferase
LDAEVWDLICSTSEGIRSWDAESLAVDVIDAVQPGGHFLDQDHDAHARGVAVKMFDRGNWETGRPTVVRSPRRRRSRANEILETHEPYPLPDGAADEIRGIVERFGRSTSRPPEYPVTATVY